MSNTEKMLDIKDLSVIYKTDLETVYAVNDVTLSLEKGATLGLVGETGAGKTTLALTLMRLLPERTGKITSGSITFEGESIVDLPEAHMRKIRGDKIAMIFQDPMTALNPVYTIGWQIEEMIRSHNKNVTKKEARETALKLLTDMGIPNPQKRIDQYPHEFSGGMRQRAMIAMAMSCNPKVLIADEPTTALDVTIQAQIFELMDHLKKNYNTAIMLITHDMGVVCELADDVAVMYMGNIIESGSAEEVLDHPTHPYTRALLKSIPVLGRGAAQDINPIKGSTPDPYNRPAGCQFAPRCDYACPECDKCMPEEVQLGGTHMVRCARYQEVTNDGR